MSRTLRIRPTGAAAAGVVIGAVVLTGCGAGQITQTSSQVASVGGVSANAGPIAIRDAQIEFASEVAGGSVYAPGVSAPLRMSIVNTGAGPDTLVSVTSPTAASVQVNGDGEIPGGQVLVVGGEPPAAEPPEPGSIATPVPPAGGSREAQIVLTGLREEIRAGLSYPLVLTFERAGQVQLDVPVGYPGVPRQDEPAG